MPLRASETSPPPAGRRRRRQVASILVRGVIRWRRRAKVARIIDAPQNVDLRWIYRPSREASMTREILSRERDQRRVKELPRPHVRA